MIDNNIYPNLNKILRTPSMISIINNKIESKFIEEDQQTIYEEDFNNNNNNNYMGSVNSLSDINNFNLSPETLLLFNNYIINDDLFTRKLKYISLIKDVIKSPELFAKFRENIKVLHLKRVNDLKLLISKLTNEISLFSNKILLSNEYNFNIEDINTLDELRIFISSSSLILNKTFKPYEF